MKREGCQRDFPSQSSWLGQAIRRAARAHDEEALAANRQADALERIASALERMSRMYPVPPEGEQ